MTRADLYELVWTKPMTHLAREFGMSDVALRKHCVKHDIPTPPLGYWAKLAHGKPVRKPALPNKRFSPDGPVYLTRHDPVPVSVDEMLAQNEAEAAIEQIRSMVEIPLELPEKPHTIVRSLRAALRKTKPDSEGFLKPDAKDLPQIAIGRESINRCLCLWQGFLTASESLGHHPRQEKHGFFLEVDGEKLRLRMYAGRDRRPHEPTPKELREQQREDARRAEYPTWYSHRQTSRKTYRTWDYFPSLRLTLELTDDNKSRWSDSPLTRYWRDTKSRQLEERLPEILAWQKPAAVIARTNRLAIEEKERKQAEESARRDRINQRIRMAKQMEGYLAELTEGKAKLDRLDGFIQWLSGQVVGDSSCQLRLLDEAKAYRMILKAMLEQPSIQSRLESIGLLNEPELVMPSLNEEALPSWCYY